MHRLWHAYGTTARGLRVDGDVLTTTGAPTMLMAVSCIGQTGPVCTSTTLGLPVTDRRPRVLLSLPEAAAYLGRNEHYLRRLVSKRDLRHYRLDGRLRFDQADLDAFLDAHVVEPRAASSAQW